MAKSGAVIIYMTDDNCKMNYVGAMFDVRIHILLIGLKMYIVSAIDPLLCQSYNCNTIKTLSAYEL